MSTSLSRIAEALEKLLEEEAPQYDPYRNEQRIADALERIANVLEFRMPWLGANVYTVPAIQNPYYPSLPNSNPGITYGINAVGPIQPQEPLAPTSGSYTPPVAYPDLGTKDNPF